MNIYKKIQGLLIGALKSKAPFRYLLSRAVINAPHLFPFFYIKRQGYKLAPSRSSLVSGMISEGQGYLRSQENLICSMLRPGDLFIDVGANIGNLSLAAKARIRNCQVFAIEANHSTYNALCRNIAANNLSIAKINAAVGENNGGSVLISNSVFDDWNCVLDKAKFTDDASKLRLLQSKIAPQAIPKRSLDSLASEFQWPTDIRLLKIDIEGYELFALKGGLSLIGKTQLILLEFSENHSARYGYERKDILDFLFAHSFYVHIIREATETLDEVLANPPIAHACEAPLYCDILAVQRAIAN